jgi:hypothetical protein
MVHQRDIGHRPDMDNVIDTNYANRARLGRWAKDRGGEVGYLVDADGAWTTTVRIPHPPETFIFTSGPVLSIEVGAASVLAAIGESGFSLD